MEFTKEQNKQLVDDYIEEIQTELKKYDKAIKVLSLDIVENA